MVRSLQCSVKTYCEEVQDGDYSEWKMGFRLEEKGEEIERLVEENGVIGEIYDEVVPKKVDDETFWCLYFYKVQKVIEAEEARARFVRRSIAEEEEELSWDVDDDDNDGDISCKVGDRLESKDELNNDIEDNGKKVQNLQLKSGEKGVERDGEDEAGVSGSKGEISAGEESLEERLKSDDKESEGKIESDFSVVSSQRFDEDYVGWDEIEAAFGSGDEGKVTDHGSSSGSNLVDLRIRLSAAEQDEELNWDVEDDTEDHIKS
ncbi:BSD domain-containing protein 1-like [Dorcoceras hygrometricum]|uniref:BSD domain-containing protein 1-like n=1 Tax=Dorcoceras hygrometricum TaxID=472368 RepID=A0A2Z7B3B0_9LAMI|nr:BSD domain-containing protein 1-like [Dorcoceras hygrometricum]